MNEFEGLVKTCSAYFRKKKKKVNYNTNEPWFNVECRRLKRDTRKLLNKFRVSGCDVDLNLYLQSKYTFKGLCKSKRRWP